jgi:hypothetical protein
MKNARAISPPARWSASRMRPSIAPSHISAPRRSARSTKRGAVGRDRLPSTVLGLLFHAAEHAQRHSAQIITTAKIVAG